MRNRFTKVRKGLPTYDIPKVNKKSLSDDCEQGRSQKKRFRGGGKNL